MCKFRLLRADEIECRIGTAKPTGVSLLLYKDARCDMAILDETVGPMGWQRTHEFKDGKLYCTVSIFDNEKLMWIDKEDVGVESNTEAEKGQASDSFKRACVNWGIGRELYTSPFIWISGNPDDLKKTKFSVSSITYDDKGRIASLAIVDDKGGLRYSYPKRQISDNMQATAEDFILSALKGCQNIKELGAIASMYSNEIKSNETLMKVYNDKKTKFQK